MEPRISIITLCVTDMARAFRFYHEGLGLPTSATIDAPIMFFQTSGTCLALYPRDKLAEEIPGFSAEGSGFSGVTLAHNTRNQAEVDQLLKQAEAAGGRIVKPASDTSWGGYSGYFTDPDGHLWEVAWSKDWKFQEDGSLVIE